jgi:hypothetical protein
MQFKGQDLSRQGEEPPSVAPTAVPSVHIDLVHLEQIVKAMLGISSATTSVALTAPTVAVPTPRDDVVAFVRWAKSMR